MHHTHRRTPPLTGPAIAGTPGRSPAPSKSLSTSRSCETSLPDRCWCRLSAPIGLVCTRRTIFPHGVLCCCGSRSDDHARAGGCRRCCFGVCRPRVWTATGNTPGRRGQPVGGQALLRRSHLLGDASREGANNPQLTAIANTPASYWLDQAFPSSTVAGTVSRYAGAAQAARAMPVLTLYAIPNRDCGSFAAGGFASGAEYRRWIDAVSTGLGGAPAAIILEPDALAMADCLSGDQRQERFDLMSYAVDKLTANPAAAVYVDGGHSLAGRRRHGRQAELGRGVAKARGFSLNTANFSPPKRDRVRRNDFGAHQRFALRDRHVAQRRRSAPETRSTGVTRPAAHWASHPLPTRRARTPTPTCGSNVPANPTDPATVGNPGQADS